jgi:hypothetical protein
MSIRKPVFETDGFVKLRCCVRDMLRECATSHPEVGPIDRETPTRIAVPIMSDVAIRPIAFELLCAHAATLEACEVRTVVGSHQIRLQRNECVGNVRRFCAVTLTWCRAATRRAGKHR